jgi:Tol biopolymer transport system component
MRTNPGPISSRVTLAGNAMRLIVLAATTTAVMASPNAAAAQYFGRNKVQYEKFKFEVLRTAHFDVHYYAAERPAAEDAARMLERWNTRLSGLFNHPLSARKPIVLYADQPDFQQTNVISGQLDEGTGGVTESMLDRMVLPLTGSYAESDHVLGHEMVHVFQYDIVQSKGNGASLDRLPLWLVEGMAEYLSLGGEDSHTAMWLRDAVLRNDLPTIKQLTNGNKYFPYRYGEALWAYIGGTWGDETVPRLYRASLSVGFDDAIRSVLGMSSDSLSTRWRAAIRAQYTPLVEGRTRPAETGDRVIVGSGEYGDYNVSPAISPDGKLVAYYSSRDLTGIDLYLADAVTGKVQGKLAAPGVMSHFDALSFLYSAGSWSPDAKQLAFITYADGDNEINIVDVKSHKITKHFKPRDIGAVSSVAWSPDGRQIAFSGMKGGLSDLYLYDVGTGAIRQLTSDRFADMQPAWSPDGRTIAFVTDRGAVGADSANAGTDFQRLRYARLKLALIDVASGQVRVLPGTPGAKHINPQYSADGKSLYFVSDIGGFTDIYRMEIEGGATFRVTRSATGVSGVAATSPAIAVARENGRVLFSVFDKAGFHISALPAERARGEPVKKDGTRPITEDTDGSAPDTIIAPRDATPKSAAVLPTDRQAGPSTISAYLQDSDRGLPSDSAIVERPYRTTFRLAAIGQPSLGVGSSSVLGTQFSGGASAYFSDMLGNQSIGVAVQASGQIRDIGGQLLYLNTANRWNWGLSVSRTPYVYSYGALTNVGAQYVFEHIAIDNVSAIAQYPLSQTRRIEFSTGYTHYGYSFQTVTQGYNGGTSGLDDLPAPPGLGLTSGSVALVGDASSFGFTSPISGSRYRFEVTPTVGTLNYQTLLLDYRKYLFVKPITFAVRGMHYGLYGKDSETDRIGSLYVGDGSLVRGYSYDSYSANDCTSNGSGGLAGSTCPQFDRLVGSRLALANAEIRIPLFGTSGFGLISSPLPPIEIAPFVDAGVAWTKSSGPVWDFTSTSGERTPVVSTGIASRINLFGFAVFQVYYAHPFQRPGRGGVWGFVLQPGW